MAGIWTETFDCHINPLKDDWEKLELLLEFLDTNENTVVTPEMLCSFLEEIN
jgi:hypothetical protein